VIGEQKNGKYESVSDDETANAHEFLG